MKSLTSSLNHVGRCILLGWVRVTIVTNGWRLWMAWLRIDHNGVGVYTLCLPLNYEIKVASYLSFYELILSFCTISLYAIFLLYITTIDLTTPMYPVFILLC
ncbi:unnamed protein product [Schistosoma mattheei]|uniref:Uncharacterized protein n=1 Tax=Schistosoma mattheei TaxID=31246 RepID=A0A3P8DNA5_9TREM|nr:unnamed protein product [Schistosoma mattheei]